VSKRHLSMLEIDREAILGCMVSSVASRSTKLVRIIFENIELFLDKHMGDLIGGRCIK